MINLFLAISLPFALGLGAVNTNVEDYHHEENINNSIDFNDNGLLIDIGVNELNNYTFENLANYLNNYYTTHGNEISWLSYIVPGTVYQSYFLNFELEEFIADDYWRLYTQANYDYYDLLLEDGQYFLVLDLNTHYKWSLNYENETPNLVVDDIAFTNILTLDFADAGQSVYNDFKTALQLDIQVNQPTSNMPMLSDILSDIVSLLSNGLVNMGTGVANGINSFVQLLMIQNGTTSVFIGVVAIFGGVALAVALTRRVFGWIESLGARG